MLNESRPNATLCSMVYRSRMELSKFLCSSVSSLSVHSSEIRHFISESSPNDSDGVAPRLGVLVTPVIAMKNT